MNRIFGVGETPGLAQRVLGPEGKRFGRVNNTDDATPPAGGAGGGSTVEPLKGFEKVVGFMKKGTSGAADRTTIFRFNPTPKLDEANFNLTELVNAMLETAGGSTRVVFNLAGVEDSTLGPLVRFVCSFSRTGKGVILCGLSSKVAKTIEEYDLYKVGSTQIYDNEQTALTKLGLT